MYQATICATVIKIYIVEATCDEINWPHILHVFSLAFFASGGCKGSRVSFEYVKRAPGSFLNVSQREKCDWRDDDKQFTEVMKRQNN